MEVTVNVLVLVGSLRADSLNRRLARAAASHLAADTEVRFFDRLGELPHYSEELDGPDSPEAVAALRRAIGEADALIVTTPEYNGLLSGLVKNAVDWASRPRGTSTLAGKPAAVLSATPSPRGGEWARESAVRALRVAGADALEQSVGVGGAHVALDGDILVDDVARQAVADLMASLTDQVRREDRAA
jgi:NAD(P)H-dependent FMN reductase